MSPLSLRKITSSMYPAGNHIAKFVPGNLKNEKDPKIYATIQLKPVQNTLKEGKSTISSPIQGVTLSMQPFHEPRSSFPFQVHF